jgi:hypothetical protein
VIRVRRGGLGEQRLGGGRAGAPARHCERVTTVKVRIALKSKDARIVPDMGVRVSFLEQEDKKAAAVAQAAPRTLVPAQALRKDGEQDVVFVMRDGKAERRAVKLGGNVGENRQVLAGVSAGERVITEAPATLKDGDTVEVADSK